MGDVETDLARRRVTKGGRLVHLAQTEYTRVYVARLRARLESPAASRCSSPSRSGYRFALPSPGRVPLAASGRPRLARPR